MFLACFADTVRYPRARSDYGVRTLVRFVAFLNQRNDEHFWNTVAVS